MDDIATLVKEALPMCSTPATQQPIMDVLQDVGVEMVDDMKLIQINDLAGVLRPIQARKLNLSLLCMSLYVSVLLRCLLSSE